MILVVLVLVFSVRSKVSRFCTVYLFFSWKKRREKKDSLSAQHTISMICVFECETMSTTLIIILWGPYLFIYFFYFAFQFKNLNVDLAPFTIIINCHRFVAMVHALNIIYFQIDRFICNKKKPTNSKTFLYTWWVTKKNPETKYYME